MSSRFCNTMLYAAAQVAAGASALALPLQRADVPANPAWVLHVDCDSLRPTAIGQFILSEMDKPGNQAKLAVFQTLFSFDPRKQLHGATLYSVGTAPEDGVLVVYADFDADKLTTLAKASEDSQHAAYKQHVIYNWIDEKKKPRKGVKPRTYAAIAGARVIFGQREARVAQALDVLDGASPSLATSKAYPELGAGGSASFLEGIARKLDLPESDPNAALFRLSKQARLQAGETQHQLTARLVLEANDEQIAGQMATVGQGLLALLKLQQKKPEAVRFADAITLKQDGARVIASLSLPAGDLIELIKADAARKAQRKAEKDHAGAK